MELTLSDLFLMAAERLENNTTGRTQGACVYLLESIIENCDRIDENGAIQPISLFEEAMKTEGYRKCRELMHEYFAPNNIYGYWFTTQPPPATPKRRHKEEETTASSDVPDDQEADSQKAPDTDEDVEATENTEETGGKKKKKAKKKNPYNIPAKYYVENWEEARKQRIDMLLWCAAMAESEEA